MKPPDGYDYETDGGGADGWTCRIFKGNRWDPNATIVVEVTANSRGAAKREALKILLK